MGVPAKEKGSLFFIKLLAWSMFIDCQKMLKVATLFWSGLAENDAVICKEKVGRSMGHVVKQIHPSDDHVW